MSESASPKVSAHGFQCSDDLFAEFKREVGNRKVSNLRDEFEDMMKKRLAEMRGVETVEDSNKDIEKRYDFLSKQFETLSMEKQRLLKVLKDSGAYKRFINVLFTDAEIEHEDGNIKLENHLRGGPETDNFRKTLMDVKYAGRNDLEGATLFIRLLRVIRQQKTIQMQIDSLDLIPKAPGSVENPIVCGGPELKASEGKPEEAKLPESFYLDPADEESKSEVDHEKLSPDMAKILKEEAEEEDLGEDLGEEEEEED